MKTIFTFCMILTCMVSFTAGATTTKPEQKQKTEFVTGLVTEINAVSVVNDYQVVFVATDAKIKTEFEVKSFELIKPSNSEATNDDVGWRSSRISYNKVLKSNIVQKNRISFVNMCRNKKASIRNDC